MAEKPIIENEVLTEPIQLNANYIGSTLTATVQPDFPLCEADYLRLTSSGSSIRDWAVNFLIATIGGALIIGGKYVASKSGDSDSPIESWELWTVAIGFIIAAALYGFSCKWPSDKSRVLAYMKDHFSSNPRQHQVMKARK